MQRYVISRKSGFWMVNNSTYGIDDKQYRRGIEKGRIDLLTPFKGFSLLNQRLVRKRVDDVFYTYEAAKLECDKRNNSINCEPLNMECYDYMENTDGSQKVFYMDDEGNETSIKVW